jgi:DNA-binding MarR family transcriptional regulator
MALTDFEKFCKYAGVNNKQLNVCIERSKGLSLGQISMKLKISKSYVKKICDRCEI